MLKNCGLEVEECYTATWRESKYTLIRVHKAHRPRKTGMQKVMDRMLKKFRVIETEIFGFDSVSSNSKAEHTSLEDHPGFKLMVQKANKAPVDLEWWIHKGIQDLAANRKGLLWRHIKNTDAKSMTRLQLIQHVETWRPIVMEVEELRSMNSMLTERVRELEQAMRDERAFNDNMLIQFASGSHPLPPQQPSLQ
jgi:FtsZ-binding cell division protein ZapB